MMRKLLVTTVSTVALLFGAATMAAAQDRSGPAAKDPAAGAPSSPTSPGAGAIKREGAMEKDPAMQQRRSTTGTTTGTATGAVGDSGGLASFSDNKDSLAGVAIEGGLTPEQLIGADVLNTSGNEVGEIEDLAVDSNGKMNKAIIGVGGFLGMGARYVAVDIALLKQSAEQKGFVTTMTEEELKILPQYTKEKGAWVRTYK